VAGDPRWGNFLERDDGNPVGIVRFLGVRNAELNRAWFDASRYWVEDVGGERIYAGDLDVVPGRSVLSFDRLVIEEYPSRQAAVEVMARSQSHAEMGLRDSFVMALTPSSRLLHRVVGLAGKVTRLLRPIRIKEVPEVQYPKDVGLGGLNSDQAQLSVFYRSDQWQPFAMVNLHAFKRRADYEDSEKHAARDPSSGAEAYQRYAQNTAIEVFRRGGNFFWIARPIAVLVGESDHPLGRQWSQFVLATWPSRMAFRHLLVASKFNRAFAHRDAGLSESIAIPGTPWPNFIRPSL